MAKLVSMERTKAERKAAEDRYKEMPISGSDFPYGLTINLGKDELAKLGVTKMPGVDDEIELTAMCKVTRVSSSASTQGDDSKSVELQITSMCIEPEADEPTGFQKAADKLYKGK